MKGSEAGFVHLAAQLGRHVAMLAQAYHAVRFECCHDGYDLALRGGRITDSSLEYQLDAFAKREELHVPLAALQQYAA